MGWRMWPVTEFQSTHLLRGATRYIRSRKGVMIYFNPRTSHEVRQKAFRASPSAARHFNPRTSHEVRQKTNFFYGYVFEFQSTHLSRGATEGGGNIGDFDMISIHAPLTRCDIGTEATRAGIIISIHAPLTRCDPPFFGAKISVSISIHAPLTRCDVFSPDFRYFSGNFNPRTSHEVRPT